jgi:hypothetical protein
MVLGFDIGEIDGYNDWLDCRRVAQLVRAPP